MCESDRGIRTLPISFKTHNPSSPLFKVCLRRKGWIMFRGRNDQQSIFTALRITKDSRYMSSDPYRKMMEKNCKKVERTFVTRKHCWSVHCHRVLFAPVNLHRLRQCTKVIIDITVMMMMMMVPMMMVMMMMVMVTTLNVWLVAITLSSPSTSLSPTN